jgi:hypothetical protein
MDETSVLFLSTSHKYNRSYGGSNTQLSAMTSEWVELLPDEKVRLLYLGSESSSFFEAVLSILCSAIWQEKYLA